LKACDCDLVDNFSVYPTDVWCRLSLLGVTTAATDAANHSRLSQLIIH